MSTPNIFIDGTGKFQQSTENAGAIKYGEFSQVSINTGNIAVSALFTGSAVNSGTIGNYLPFTTSVLVQTNSANWDAAFDAMGNFVLLNDARLTDARTPLSHTQAISTIDGLSDVLSTLESGVAQAGQISITTADISDFTTAVDALIASDSPVLSVAGKTGAVTLSTSDIQGLNAAIAAASSVTSVAGKTGAVTLGTSDITGLQTALDSKQASGSYATTTAVAALSSAIDSKQASGSYAASVHTHSTSDIIGFTSAAASAAPVQSVASKTGAVTLSTSDIQGFNADAAAQAPVQSVAGRTGAVVVSAADVAGFSAAADARIAAAAGVSVASLVGGLIPAAQLPSYVDDVLEYSALVSFPGTGETGKIYVDTTSKKIYRWSGSAYIEIAPSPGSTDSVPEGSTNLYYTNARASAAAPVQSVAGRTGAVTLGTSDISGLAATIATIPSSAQTTDWTNVSTVYKGTSASYLTSTNFTTVTAASLTLGAAMLATYTNPVTASGDFLVFTVNGKQRLIRVWDFN